jgi:hypothetical protein
MLVQNNVERLVQAVVELPRHREREVRGLRDILPYLAVGEGEQTRNLHICA